MTVFLAFVAPGTAASAPPTEKGSKPMTDMVRREIEERVRAFEAAFGRNDMAALAALYAEDASLMPPDSDTITGRPGIQRFWQGVWDSGVRGIALHSETVETGGDLAAEIATAELTTGAGDAPASVIPLKYVVVWKRRADGQWQLSADIWNGRP
jgi:uncharacterized protein (TIGR02246 family)